MGAVASKMSDKEEVVTLKVYRGEPDANGTPQGDLHEYKVPMQPGWVVLDALHWIQANHVSDLAVRWNCKAAKCGSCAGDVNGLPSLMCKTRLDTFPAGEAIVVRPMRTFPLIKDLVTDVSWNYAVAKKIQPFTPANQDSDSWRYYQEDADRVQEFRKCIECFLCQNTCHVLRHHSKFDQFYGPRFFIRLASLEMHPLDVADRLPKLKEEGGLMLCNITKCCTERCPEHIRITDNAIIPLKERVIDRYYDPMTMLLRKIGIGA
jgi:succinate dehydrogenase / fumarate reductase, iron-sulfur subunit